MTPTPLRLTSIDELITWIPFQLGHQPDGALVIVGLDRTLLLGLCRVPLTDEATGQGLTTASAVDVLDGAVATFLRAGANEFHAVAFESVPGQSEVATAALEVVATRHAVPVGALAIVHGGRRRLPWAVDPQERVHGRALAEVASCPAALHLLVQGQAPLPDRAAVRALIEADSSSKSVARALTGLTPLGGSPARREGRLWRRALDLDPGREPLTPTELARLLRSLSEVNWRDALISWAAPGCLPAGALPSPSRTALRRWLPRAVSDEVATLHRFMELARSAPDGHPMSAAICAVVGCIAWHQGNGATARDALERALRLDPDHRLAGLALRAVDLGVPPSGRSHGGSVPASAPPTAV